MNPLRTVAQPVIIAEPAYLLKRGIAALVSDMVRTDVLFIDDMGELNSHLDKNKVHAVFIDEQLLTDKPSTDLFFQLKEQTLYVGLSANPGQIRHKNKFDAVMDRSGTKEELVAAVESVLQPGTGESDKAGSLLSSREQEVLKEVALGYTNQQIAAKLYISRHTVISHRKNITAKLGIKTVSGLTVYAVLNGLIPKDQIR